MGIAYTPIIATERDDTAPGTLAFTSARSGGNGAATRMKALQVKGAGLDGILGTPDDDPEGSTGVTFAPTAGVAGDDGAPGATADDIGALASTESVPMPTPTLDLSYFFGAPAGFFGSGSIGPVLLSAPRVSQIERISD